AKDPDERFQNARDLKTALSWALETQPTLTTIANRRYRIAVAAAVAIATLAGAWVLSRSRQAPVREQAVRFQIIPPESGGRFDQSSLAVSPDGRMLAYVAILKGKRGLWVRPLDGASARLLPGSAGASQPFWSPDGKSMGYFAGAKLWRIDLAGGAPL